MTHHGCDDAAQQIRTGGITMSNRLFSFGGLLLLAGTLVLATPGSGQAQHRGGGRGGSFHSGGFHGYAGRGFHGGGFHGGYHYSYPHHGYWGHHHRYYPYYRSYGAYPSYSPS